MAVSRDEATATVEVASERKPLPPGSGLTVTVSTVSALTPGPLRPVPAGPETRQ